MVSVYEANLKSILALPKKDREAVATKLKTELKEFKERERIYQEKRKELVDLEKQYRKKQDQILANEGSIMEKINTNNMIIDHMLDEIKQHRVRLSDQDDHNDDLQQKIDTQRQIVSQREEEIQDLR